MNETGFVVAAASGDFVDQVLGPAVLLAWISPRQPYLRCRS